MKNCYRAGCSNSSVELLPPKEADHNLTVIIHLFELVPTCKIDWIFPFSKYQYTINCKTNNSIRIQHIHIWGSDLSLQKSWYSFPLPSMEKPISQFSEENWKSGLREPRKKLMKLFPGSQKTQKYLHDTVLSGFLSSLLKDWAGASLRTAQQPSSAMCTKQLVLPKPN